MSLYQVFSNLWKYHIGDCHQINSILLENLFDLGLIPLVRWKCIDFHRRCSAYWHSRTDIGVKIWISSSQGNRTESTFDIKLGGSNKFYVGSRETRVFLSTLHLQDLDLDLVSRVIRLNLCRPCLRIDYYFLHHRDSELILSWLEMGWALYSMTLFCAQGRS